MPKFRVTNGIMPGVSLWTPIGVVHTDNDGIAHMSDDQAAHLRQSYDVESLDQPEVKPAPRRGKVSGRSE